MKYLARILVSTFGLAFCLESVVSLAQNITHGPICGALTAKSARFVLRTNAATVVRVEISTDNTFINPGQSIMTNSVTTVADSDFFAVVEATGLLPATQYYYRAIVGGFPASANPTTRAVQEFKTFPFDGTASTFTFAFGSCQQDAQDPKSNIGAIFPLVARDKPAFFLQTGDWTYPDTTDQHTPGDYFNMEYSRIQQDYRSKYQNTYPMDTLFVTTPIDYVYDDHDYGSDNSDMTQPGRWNSVRGYEAMFPHYPLPNAAAGIWHKFTYGNAEFFVVDDRTQRTPNITQFDTSGGKYYYNAKLGASILQGDPTAGGELQLDWLIRSLKESKATWKFIVSPTAFNPAQRAALEFALALQGSPFDPFPLPDGSVVPIAYLAINIGDAWCGFPGDITRLVDSCNRNEVKNVIVVSGDAHTAAIDDGTHSLFPEIMAGALDRTNSQTVAAYDFFGVSCWQFGQTLAANNYKNAYGRVTVFGEDSCLFELIDDANTEIGRFIQRAGHLVATTSLMLAPNAITFDSVDVGSDKTYALLLVNTGADTLVVQNVSCTDTEFVPLQWRFVIPPGDKAPLPVLFRPASIGPKQCSVVITSNVPGGMTYGSAAGVGRSPLAVQASSERISKLYPPFPNPSFGGNISLVYDVADHSPVRIAVLDVSGKTIRVVTNSIRERGTYAATVVLSGLSAGTYFVTFDVASGSVHTVSKVVIK